MLNQKALTDWIGASLEKELADTIKLVIAWPYNSLYRFRLALFFFFYYLCIIFQNVCERVFCQNFLPKVFRENLGFSPRVSCTSVYPFVERQEPAVLAFQLGAHHYLLVINSKMDRAATRCKERVCGRTVILILFYGIFNSLPCVMILKFSCDYRETVDEYADIESVKGVFCGMVKLTCDTEDVPLVKVYC